MNDKKDWAWKLSYQNLIKEEELLSLQKHFCSAAGVCAYCVDAYGEKRTEISGNPQDVERILKHIDENHIKEALSRVEEGSLEELVVEDTGAANLKFAVLSVRVQHKVMINWVLFGFINDIEDPEGTSETECVRTISEMEFYQAIDLLMVCSRLIFQNKMVSVNVSGESGSRYSLASMQSAISRTDTMTAVVELLDRDDVIENIMAEFLKIVGECLHMTSGYVCHLDYRDHTADILASWHAKGAAVPFERTRNLPAEDIMFTSEPIIVDSDSIVHCEEAEKWRKDGVRAFVLFPLMRNAESGMCISFCQLQTDRIWTMDEAKFVADAVRVLQSILTKRIQKNSLVGSYASLEAILDNVSSGIYVKDEATGKVLFINKQLKNHFEKELKDGSFEELLKQEGPFQKAPCSREINHVERERWYDLLHTDIVWVDGRKAALYSLYDITDKKVYQRKIEQQAYTDFLTGLYNRMCCERDLAVYVDKAEKDQVKGALLYLDLDNFKHINDGLGHQYGDVLLRSISGELSRVKGIEKTCYRMGGDEFVIIVPPDKYEHIEEILADIQQIFARPWFLKNMDYYCTMSMGVVEFPGSGNNVQELIKKADIAMYEAKKSGKNRISRYQDGQDASSGRRLEMEKNMRDATVSGYKDFTIYYQPIVDISKPGTPCTGAEALLRWNCGELGAVSPSDFIPLAEYLGLINPIGNYVLKEACKECRKWIDNGHPNYKVNVNLSVVQLLQPDIVDIVKNALEESGLPPKNLTLEVTESLAINDMDRMKDILSKIRKLGVRIALDDFGTGYSSLNHIKELPFDVIKVDQTFVKELAKDTYFQSFIKMVAELADTLGVSICVEGIETEEQYKLLEDMKVLMVQGYYFDRPMTRQAFETKYLYDGAEPVHSDKIVNFPFGNKQA
ncbi:MAG: EAL domain-containing protein [Lachnospiraceae bacterium]